MSPEERLAVAEDRIERTNRDYAKMLETIEDLDKLVRDHMIQEEEDRAKDKAERTEELGAVYQAINSIKEDRAAKKGYFLGVVATTSVFWVIVVAVLMYFK